MFDLSGLGRRQCQTACTPGVSEKSLSDLSSVVNSVFFTGNTLIQIQKCTPSISFTVLNGRMKSELKEET